MRAKTPVHCTNCRRLQARLDAFEVELVDLKKVVAELSRQLATARKDSSTSSKPPSSDIVKPPKPEPPEGQDRRRIGGQPGHPKHERAAFPPESMALSHGATFCPDSCCVSVAGSAWSRSQKAKLESRRPRCWYGQPSLRGPDRNAWQFQ